MKTKEQIEKIEKKIEELQCEVEKLKCDNNFVDLDYVKYNEYHNYLWVNTGAGSFWLSRKYNWIISTEGGSQILVPTKKKDC